MGRPAPDRQAGQRAGDSDPRELLLKRLDFWAKLLDTQYRIPMTSVRFGVDPVLGLLPGLGDAVGLILSSYILFQAAKHRAPGPLLAKMAGNVGVEFVIGIVPVLGNAFDVYWRSNLRNVNLLREFLMPEVVARERRQKQFRRLRQLALLALFVFCLGLLAYAWHTDLRLIPDYRAWYAAAAAWFAAL